MTREEVGAPGIVQGCWGIASNVAFAHVHADPHAPVISNAFLKRLAERTLAKTVGGGLAMRRMRGRCLVLAYHNVLPPGEAPCGDSSLHMPWSDFLHQLDVLAEHTQVVPLQSLLDDPSDLGSEPRVVITFDDAYAGAVCHALPELARRRMPATMFVAPGLLDGAVFWWDLLAGVRGGAVPHALRERLLTELRGVGADIAAWATEQGMATVIPPEYARGASVQSLDSASRLAGITFGAHSWGHPNLTQLTDDAQLAAELSRPSEWLARFGGRAIAAIAYPYGLFDERVEAHARRAGFRLSFRVVGGWMTRDASCHEPLPRYNVPARTSRDGFMLRIAGLFT